MFKTRFIAIFLCLTTVFATFAGVSFAEDNVDEETIVIENGKVVSGDSTLVDQGFIVIEDSEESDADTEAAEEGSELSEEADEAAEEGSELSEEADTEESTTEELSDEAKLDYIMGNLGSLFKPVQSASPSTPAETPSAVNPSAPVETPQSITEAENLNIVPVTQTNSYTITSDYLAKQEQYGHYYYMGQAFRRDRSGHNAVAWMGSYEGNDSDNFRVYSGVYSNSTGINFSNITNTTYKKTVANNWNVIITNGKTLQITTNTAGLNLIRSNNYLNSLGTKSVFMEVTQYKPMYYVSSGTLRVIGANYATNADTPGANSDALVFDANGQLTSSDPTGQTVESPILRVDADGTLELRNVVFKDSILSNASDSNYKNGAAIYVDGGTLKLQNVTFVNCETSQANNGDGGAIYIKNNGKVLIKNCAFGKNQESGDVWATLGGGICLTGGTVDMVGSSVINCHSLNGTEGAKGGFAYISSGTFNIKNSTIGHTSADTNGRGGYTDVDSLYGGAFYVAGTGSTLNLHTGTVLQDCEAANNGGAIYVTGGTLKMYNGAVIKNSYSESYGGAIYAEAGADVYIYGGTISNNTANRGAGIAVIGVGHFILGEEEATSGPSITGNTAGLDGGGIYAEKAGVLINDATISDNTSIHGAGLYMTDSGVTNELKVTIKKGDIINNIKGSGIWMSGASGNTDLNITGGNISGNTLTADGHGYGGAGICATMHVDVNISGTEDSPVTIKNNVNSANDIRATVVNGSASTSNQKNYKFDTSMNGGGIACIEREETAAEYKGTLTIKGNVTISGNSVPNGGAASETSTAGKGCGGGIFMEEGGTVIIESVIENGVTYKPTISNNTAYRGGGVYVSGAATYNTNGGVSASYDSKLTVNGATFENNVSTENSYALSGGTTSTPRGLAGGAICVFYRVETSIKDASFTSNRANMATGVGGGGISAVALGSITIEGCTFNNNYVGTAYDGTITGDGGAVFCRNVADVDVTNCTVNGNKAQQGGGLYVIRDDYYQLSAGANVDVDITGSTFSGNSDGGLFFQRNADADDSARTVTVDIGTTTIDGNTLGNHGSHKFGGAGITCANGITLNLNSGTVISGNTNNEEYVPSGSNEGNDTAANGGGVAMIRKESNKAYITAGTLTVNGGVTISGNTAKYGNGGGIYIEDSTGSLDINTQNGKAVTISGNTAGYEGYADGSTYRDEASGLCDGFAGSGGGICAGVGSKISIKGTASAKVVVSENQAIGGTTNHGGGGIRLNKNKALDGTSAVEIEYAVITDNEVKEQKGDGGGIDCRETDLTISNCALENNKVLTANSNGGGINMPNSYKLKITDCEFINNQANGWGGGIAASNSPAIEVFGSVFDGNVARRGGGVDLYKGTSNSMGSFSVTDTNFGNNQAKRLGNYNTDGGGAISIHNFKVTLENCNIGMLDDGNGQLVPAPNLAKNQDAENGIVGDGGGIYLFGTYGTTVTAGTLTLKSGVNICYNEADVNGGGVYFGMNSVVTAFTDVVINNNTAGSNGGGIYVTRSDANNAYVDEAGKRLDLNSCTIKDNEAKLGGGVYANNTIVTVKSSNGKETLFENNTAAQGGAIYLDDGNTKELTLDAFKISGTTKFISNEANGFVDAENSENNLSGDGGAIYVNGGRGFIVNSVFEKNTAEDNGGAVYINGNDTYGHYGIATVAFGNSDSTLSSTSYNSATNGNGGAVCVVGGHHFVVVRGGFYANQAPNGEGGGVYVEGVENTVITRDATVFNGCHSAGISNDIENFENLEVIFSGNQAGNGGAVAVKSNATLDYTRILYNTAYQNGGGIYAADGAVVTANRLVVFYNDALNNGGGLCAVGGAQITCNTELGAAIYENDAQNNGGGVYVEGTGSKVTLGKGYIYKNWAGYQPTNKSVIVATMPEGSTTMDSAANVHGVGGGVAVFDGGAFEMKSTGAIYDNRAAIGARDVFANGSDTKLTILAANAIDKDGAMVFNASVNAFVREDNNTNGMWWEDYKNGDTMYTIGLYGDPTGVAQRYEDSAVSIRAFVDANEDVGSEQYKERYVNMDDQFVSIVFEVQKYNVGTITITAPDGEGVENQRFVFEVKGDPVKGDDFTLTVSLLGGESVTITDLVPGTYTITQKTDWSWRFDYKNVTITGIEDNVGVNKGNGVVEITIKGTTRDEAHAVDYDNEKVENKWLSHNSEGVENVAKTIANVSFDMAEAKKGYVI